MSQNDENDKLLRKYDDPKKLRDYNRREKNRRKWAFDISKIGIKLKSFKKIKLILLIFVFLMCAKGLDGRPHVMGLESGESKGGLLIDATGGGAASSFSGVEVIKKPEHLKPKPQVTLALPDGDVPAIQRYPVSQVDFDHVKTPFIIGAWILSAGIAKIAFHMTPKLHKFVPESCLLIIVGVVVGVIMLFSTNVFVSPLTPNTFFLYMLPPIILDAGYFMPNRKFFDNLGTILLMAVVGTIFNIITIGGALYLCGLTGIYGLESSPGFLDIFLFASLISAVDPVAVLAVFEEIKVNEILYIVVFGESLLNDAVTVVMYHMMEAYDEIGVDNIIAQDIISGIASFFVVALGGTVIGIIWGFLLGFITRFTRHVLIIEPIFVFLMAYLSYLNAEIFHMSGILAITFCGIVAKNYVESNISSKSQTTIKYALKMLSNSSETIIFMFLGVASVHSSHEWNTWFVVLTIAFCSIFRSLGVLLFSALANRFRLHKLSGVDQFVMSYGGLRGAVAFALVLLIDERVVKQKDMFVTTTIAVIYFTVFLQGITIKPLVEILNVKRANKKDLTMNERINERFIDHVMAGIEDIIGHNNGNYNLRDKFRRFNDRFIRPHLIRDIESAERKFLKTYSKLMLRDAMVIMQRSPSSLGQILDSESMNGSIRKSSTSLTVDSTDFRSRCIDIHELDYYPSKRDIFDAEIHHLSLEPYRPFKNRPKLIKPKNGKPGSKSNDRTSKIRFRRYITNRKHLRFLQQSSFHSHSSDKMQQNLVSFSDQQKEAKNSSAPNGTLNHNKDDDDDVGLTFVINKKNDSCNLSNVSSLGDDMHCSDNSHSHLPWRESANKKKNSTQKLSACADGKENMNCDNLKTNLEDLLKERINTSAHTDINTNMPNSTPVKRDVNGTTSSDCHEDHNTHSMNDNCNGEIHHEFNEQPLGNYDLPFICEDLADAEMHELDEELFLLLNSSTSNTDHANANNCRNDNNNDDDDECIEVTMALLHESSSECDEDEDFDKYCEK